MTRATMQMAQDCLGRIKELEKEKAYAEEQLDKQIEATLKLQKEYNNLKANFDYILEGKENEYREERKKLCDDFENMKAGLESQIATLGERCNQLLKDKGELTDKIADLKETNAILSESAAINHKDLEYKVSVIEQRNKKIAELEQQIEKMKCCENCKFKDCDKSNRYQTCWYCKNKDKWQLRR